ncbi:DUF2142 domain-containing protein [Actinotignum sanguinis]|uniref:DUF2142 domain-containing protein n=2 Tax=Actinomycetaceae TaxID=2049 RepID=A0ABZ0RC08_9ACTO|nr:MULTISPECIES: DUF2142 domain-containing protein [Actinotignum]WPJ88287.1 DUF2142 domain-containing protein [Schaalia turicensis]MDE1653701.1 DUF2142 domain-containing protein [Actinotignum schaalii]MDK8286073.1 DUF2142 domain-containing protein [Actinotignum sanguinis]MDK8511941.1 DUF2142 domain-containing protein [Actinotignum sanguinis]MDK8518923.1 DUF2142 domain-containing protein [Actinotignum sanguinis]
MTPRPHRPAPPAAPAAPPAPTDPPAPTARGLWSPRIFLFSFLAFLCYTTGLSLLTPLQGSPDEPVHEIYGYQVVTGNIPLESERVLAPRYLRSGAPDCWRTTRAQTAWCSPPLSSDATLREMGTSAVNYPPLYYALTHQPLRFLSGAAALWAVRICSALLFSLLAAFGVSAFVAGLPHRLEACIALTVLTPAFFTFAGFSNPQSLEIGAALAMAGCLIPLVQSLSPRETARRWIAGGCAAVLLILARPVGPYWAIAMCLLLAGVLGRERVRTYIRTRAFGIFMALCAAGCLGWLTWTRISTIYGPTPTEVINDGWGALTLRLLGNFRYYMHETIGTAGWRSVTTSVPVTVLYWVVIFAVVAAAWHGGKARHRVSIALAFISLPLSAVLMNTLVLSRTTFPIWQGRYGFPFLFPLFWVCVMLIATSGRRRSTVSGALARATSALFFLATVDITVRMAWRFYAGITTAPLGRVLTDTPPHALIGAALAITVAGTYLVFTWRYARRCADSPAPVI